MVRTIRFCSILYSFPIGLKSLRSTHFNRKQKLVSPSELWFLPFFPHHWQVLYTPSRPRYSSTEIPSLWTTQQKKTGVRGWVSHATLPQIVFSLNHAFRQENEEYDRIERLLHGCISYLVIRSKYGYCTHYQMITQGISCLPVVFMMAWQPLLYEVEYA